MTADDAPITVRRMRFVFPAEGLDPLIIEGQPEESYLHVGLSLLLPHLEPYLIRSMNAAKAHIRDPKLLADLALFNAQEGQHYRQHILFNQAVHLAGFESLKPLEAELAEDYRRFTAERSLRFNLAYAEGFEALTTTMAHFSFEHRLTDRLHPSVKPLFEWHLVEELEHRNVAFDVYAAVFGGYFYRLAVGLYAQWHLNRFVVRAMSRMIDADRPAFLRKWGGVRTGLRRTWPLMSLALRHLLPKVLATYMPWYTPHRVRPPDSAAPLSRFYSEQADALGAARQP